MASAIDDTKPAAGNAYTADMRANFAAAKSEIEALQNAGGAVALNTSVRRSFTFPNSSWSTITASNNAGNLQLTGAGWHQLATLPAMPVSIYLTLAWTGGATIAAWQAVLSLDDNYALTLDLPYTTAPDTITYTAAGTAAPIAAHVFAGSDWSALDWVAEDLDFKAENGVQFDLAWHANGDQLQTVGMYLDYVSYGGITSLFEIANATTIRTCHSDFTVGNYNNSAGVDDAAVTIGSTLTYNVELTANTSGKVFTLLRRVLAEA